jgi:NAD(P)-dependent dehydrogenase (short-subunit alcohol dehydrogenase family)
VNISSVAGRVAPAGFAAYAATKWGINGWSEALRVELQPDIRVTVIEAGAIATGPKRLKGLEPSTFCMASRRSSQLSYSRSGPGV